jgi:hypothetical protein
MDTNALIEARKKAELAVAEMSEGELRVEAFKIILNRLLAEGGNAAPPAKGRASHPQHDKRRNPDSSSEADEDGVPHSAPARVLALKAEGFFGERRGISDIRDELQTHGWRYDITALSGTLMSLVQKRQLRRSKVEDGNKTTYKYFNP